MIYSQERTNSRRLTFIGKVLDRDYRTIASHYGFPIDKKHGDDLTRFPIEKARLRSLFYFLTVAIGTIAAYGWCLEVRSVSLCS